MTVILARVVFELEMGKTLGPGRIQERGVPTPFVLEAKEI